MKKMKESESIMLRASMTTLVLCVLSPVAADIVFGPSILFTLLMPAIFGVGMPIAFFLSGRAERRIEKMNVDDFLNRGG